VLAVFDSHDPYPSLLAGLDDAQRAAVTSDAAPLAILAPAGSGKTRVLTRRIAWRARTGSLNPKHVLAVTFTRKAAGELARRLARLGVDEAVTAGTFHALALAQLRRRAEEAGREAPRVLERKARVLARVIGGRGSKGTTDLFDIAAEIEWAKARMITPDQFAVAAARAGRQLPRPTDALADIYARYELEKRRRRIVDFDDLLWWCAHAMETDETFAAAQRWRFRHLFVDEFQDASPLSVRLVAAWLGDRRDLCVVGDPAQAIYGFAGADPSFLDDFAQHFPGGTSVRLQVNYRSTPQVVRTAAAVLGRREQSREVQSTRDDGPMPTTHVFDDDDAEATGVARAFSSAHLDGVPWEHMAVLFRTNNQSTAFERAFTHAGIPFTVGTRGSFFDRETVGALVERLEKADRAAPGRRLADHVSDLLAWADDDEPSDDARADAAALARLADEYLAAEGGKGTLSGFLAWAAIATRGENGNGGNGGHGVECCTFHRAKGLEWSLVWVAGLETGFVPISYATSEAALDEERRLLHVALSRAHDALHLSWAQRRTFGDRTNRREPSPWLVTAAGACRPGPADRIRNKHAALADLRRTLAAAEPPPPRSRARRTR
jgi:DNA helicase-2/ATP-dependent DNA helicase PcrA